MHHDLKTLPQFFQRVKSGEKPFELRFNDRDFQKGDTVCLREYDKEKGLYSGDMFHGRITYVLSNFKGLEPGYCIFGLEMTR